MDTNKAKATSKAKAAKAQAEEPALVGEVITADEAPESAVVVVDNTKALNAIAKKVKAEFGRGIDSQFAIGHLLNQARTLMPGDTEFGRWLKDSGFLFSQSTAIRLRKAADREPEVRAFIAESSETGRDIGPVTAIQRIDAGPQASEEEQATGKRVRDLLKEEPEPVSSFPAFKAAAEALNLQTLTVEELADFATIVQSLVASYGDERKRRSA